MEITQYLMDQVQGYIAEIGKVPCLFGGDWNMDYDHLDWWELGYSAQVVDTE